MNQKTLKNKLFYNPETGIFTWKNTKANRIKSGDVAGHKCLGHYVKINIAGKLYYAHRLAFLYMLGRLPAKEVDHINGNKHDNSWKNLRECTRTENFFNKAKTKANKSGYKGVSFDKSRKKFISNATIKGKTFYLGRYDCPIKAHEAYLKFCEKHHGEFNIKHRKEDNDYF